MNLRQLEHFVLVAEERSFRRASERAHLSQPALSHSIKALETQLDTQLFRRTNQLVEMTAIGEALLSHAHKVLFDARNLHDQLSVLKTGGSGHVRIGLVPTYAFSFGGQVIADWLSARPGVSIEAVYQTSATLETMLREDKIDLFVCDMRNIEPDAEIELTPIGVFPGGFFCRADHPLLERDGITLADVADYGLATVRVPPSLRSVLVKEMQISNPEAPGIRVECDAITVLRDVTLKSDVVLMANPFNFREDLESGRLRQLKLDFDLEIHWAIARLRNRILSPAALALMDMLHDTPKRALDELQVSAP
ncbi:LysR family transcriptional regulator [Tropicibacter sp. Alg240-R139]|uniref:LysR family transcriptional regulator n=1 Tax=Tropicibacter sp. Alg240-R139 TaxID=2305991 RepID=UPI0013DF9D26|nr:LysR family transcriptional regulator [Tropicibacter sp. Alg240-R139]